MWGPCSYTPPQMRMLCSVSGLTITHHTPNCFLVWFSDCAGFLKAPKVSKENCNLAEVSETRLYSNYTR